MKVVAVIQARMGSTRLPGKILKPVLDRPMLAQMLERVKRAKKLDAIIVATTDTKIDDATENLAVECGVNVFRGDELNVLDRFYRAAKDAGADVVVRITGDCPLHDPVVIDEVLEHFSQAQADYTSTPANYPEGLDTEVFTFAALECAWLEATLPSEKEHVTPFIKNHPELFTCDRWVSGKEDYSQMHWSVDTPADFEFVTEVYTELYQEGDVFGKDDVLALLARRPGLLTINKGGTGYEGLEKSLQEDEALKNLSHDSTTK